MGHLETELGRLVDDRLHDVAVHAEELDAVGALLLDGPDGLAPLLRRPPAGDHVDIDPGRDDRALLALAPLGQGLLGIGADVPHRRDAAGQIDLVLVFERLGDAGPLVVEMDMAVDEAGQEVHPGAVEDVRLALVSVGAAVGAADGGDPVALDDDVHRTAHRRALAVDDQDVADDQPVVAPAVLDAAAFRGRREREAGQEQNRQKYPVIGTVSFFMSRSIAQSGDTYRRYMSPFMSRRFSVLSCVSPK